MPATAAQSIGWQVFAVQSALVLKRFKIIAETHFIPHF
jgi:hypothetical protein